MAYFMLGGVFMIMIPAKIFTEVEGWSALDAMYFIEGSENFFDSKNRFLDFNKIDETETHFQNYISDNNRFRGSFTKK